MTIFCITAVIFLLGFVGALLTNNIVGMIICVIFALACFIVAMLIEESLKQRVEALEKKVSKLEYDKLYTVSEVPTNVKR